MKKKNRFLELRVHKIIKFLPNPVLTIIITLLQNLFNLSLSNLKTLQRFFIVFLYYLILYIVKYEIILAQNTFL